MSKRLWVNWRAVGFQVKAILAVVALAAVTLAVVALAAVTLASRRLA